MSLVEQRLKTALEQHRAGRLDDAERSYREIIRIDSRHADALHLLGLIAHQRKEYKTAIETIGRAIHLRPRAPLFHSNLGASYRATGESAKALKCFEEAVRLDPDSAEAQFNLGLTLRGLGRHEDAAASCLRAIELNPQNPQAHLSLGIVCSALGKHEEALTCYLKSVEIDPDEVDARFRAGTTLLVLGKPKCAIPHLEGLLTIQPDHAEARNWLGRALHDAGRLEEAANMLLGAINADPENTLAHLNLGNAFISSRQLEEARKCFQRIIDIDRDNLAGWTNLANVLKTQQKLDEAAAAYRQVMRLNPEQPLGELWLATMCPLVFQSTQEIGEYREKLDETLKGLAARKLTLDLRYFDARASTPPGHLQFHGRDDRPLLEQFARVFRQCFSKEPPEPRTGKPRIGIVVTSGHEGVFSRFQGGILERLKFDRFDLSIICSPTGAEIIRSEFDCGSISFLTLPQRFEKTVETIREARFDLLYFWETGSDVTNYFLPFCRLAPLQCIGPGNSGTSGNPAIDYCFSPHLREPDDAETHYTETLIRMRTLDSFQKRVTLSGRVKQRDEFGFTAGEHLYVCAQKIQKIHPEFDGVLADILRRDKRATVVLVQDKSGIAAEMLKQRFTRSMGDVAEGVRFLPRLDFDDYLSLISIADVLLDPIHYGGGITLYDSASLNKPMITWPSRFVRGRYAYGHYRKMGLTACVASTLDEYVDTAVALGTDRLYRSAVEAEFRAACDVIFEDTAIVAEYQRIFEMLIEESRSA